MVPLIIVGLFIVGIFNFKFRQAALTLILLIFLDRRFRHNLTILSKLFILGLYNKRARKSAFRYSKKMLKKIVKP